MSQNSQLAASSRSPLSSRPSVAKKPSATAIAQSDSALLFGLRKNQRQEDRMWLVVAMSSLALLVFSLWG